MSDVMAENVNPQAEGKTLSLNERAYLAFKHRLITLRYKPGDYLNTAQVMEDLQMGRTPVNQAVHRLATEGLLQIIPRKGVMVSPLSIDDALELIEVRLVNEALCVRLAVARISDAQIATLRQLNQQIAHAGAAHERDDDAAGSGISSGAGGDCRKPASDRHSEHYSCSGTALLGNHALQRPAYGRGDRRA